MPPITPADVRPRRRRDPPVGGDVFMAERERTPALNPAEPSSLDEMAVWGSVQVAHLFGVEPMDLRGLTFDFERFSHRRRRSNKEGWGGIVRTVEGERPTLTLNAEDVNRRTPEGDKGLLLHEMTHVYMFDQRSRNRNFGEYDDGWFQESMADYVVDALGFGRVYRGDPTEGYQKGARFLFWLEAQYPTAVGRIGQRMIDGEDPFEAVFEETGQPIPILLATYEGFPNIPHATGPMAQYLRPPKYTPEERAQMRRINSVEQQLAWGPSRRKYGGFNDWLPGED